MHSKEQDAQALFRYSETTKEPVGHQRIGQKAAAESVERKQTCQLRDDFLSRGRDLVRRNLHGWFRDLDGRGREGIKEGRNHAEDGASDKDRAV